MRYRLVIDDDGDVWPADDTALSTYLRSDRSGTDLQPFLIGNLGFIGVSPGPRRIDLTFDHQTVSPKALGGAIYWLSEQDFAPTRVTNLSSPDVVALFATRGDLIASLSDLLSQRKAVSTVTRLTIALETSAFATRWRAAMDICEEVERPQARNRILNDLFQGYFSILSRSEDGDCTIDYLGDAYAAWEPEFHAQAIGRTFRDVFDKRAGGLVADGYREIAGHRLQPAAESVRALINFPNRPARRINYDRAILPIGAHRLLVANFVH